MGFSPRSVSGFEARRPAALGDVLGPSYDVPRGTTLFRQRDRLEFVLLLEDGYVKTVQAFADRDVIVSVRASGWLLGAISALSGGTRHLLAAESLSKCVLRSVAVGRFRQLARTDLAVCSWLLDLMALESAQHLRLAALRGESATARLKRVLVELVQLDSRIGRDGSIQVMAPLTHADIAAMIGVRAAPLSRMLAAFETRGLIRRVRGRISIPRASALLHATSGSALGAHRPRMPASPRPGDFGGR